MPQGGDACGSFVLRFRRLADGHESGRRPPRPGVRVRPDLRGFEELFAERWKLVADHNRPSPPPVILLGT